MKYTTFPNCTPSASEQIIISRLNNAKVFFEREVCFEGLTNPSTGQPLRYDFYVPAFNLIIEYDGIESHASEQVRQRDLIKNRFASEHRIKLKRISGIRNIDVFFESQYWKSQVGRVVIHHKKKPKPMTKWQRNHQPKEEPKPFVPLNYSQEYIKQKIAEQKAKRAELGIVDAPPKNGKSKVMLSIDPNDTIPTYSNSKDKGKKKGSGFIKFTRGATYGTGRKTA